MSRDDTAAHMARLRVELGQVRSQLSALREEVRVLRADPTQDDDRSAAIAEMRQRMEWLHRQALHLQTHLHELMHQRPKA